MAASTLDFELSQNNNLQNNDRQDYKSLDILLQGEMPNLKYTLSQNESGVTVLSLDSATHSSQYPKLIGLLDREGFSIPIIRKSVPVLDMTCGSCAIGVEKILNTQKGVLSAEVNFANESAELYYDSTRSDLPTLRQAVKEGGYDLYLAGVHVESDAQTNGRPDGSSNDSATASKPKLDPKPQQSLEEIQAAKFAELKTSMQWSIVLAIPLVIIGMFFMNMPYANELMLALSTPIVLWFGRRFFVNAWRNLQKKHLNMDTLVAMSTGIAYIYSLFNMLYPEFWLSRGITPHVYFEAAGVIIAFILLGKYLEEKAKGNTADAIKKLMSLTPENAVKLVGGFPIITPISDLQIGDVVLVKPGERIPVDGEVIKGTSFVDESMLSGEPIPIEKAEGETVYSGTINQKGSLNIRTTKETADSLLSSIINMVRHAQGSKAPVQQTVDKIAGVFVPVVIVIAILAFAVWMFFGGDNGFSHGLLALVTVLVIACPCALGLATPTAIMVGIGKAAQNGILIKNAIGLEKASKVDVAILDKTGTLTEGKPKVATIQWNSSLSQAEIDNSSSILKNLEAQSEHPLAGAVVDFLTDQQDTQTEAVEIHSFESITGKGAKAVSDSRTYYVGNIALMLEQGIDTESSNLGSSANFTQQAMTIVWFAESNGSDNQILACLGITDHLKATSKEAVAQMQNAGIEVIMLTGDNKATAKAVASQVGISNYQAETLPADKAEVVKELQAKGKVVAMVGDGINDSAALAQADVSIAMGKGSDIAMDVASMTIISDNLMKVKQAIDVSNDTVRTIKQNLFWAFIYNLIGIPIAAGVLYPFNGFLLSPMIAGAAMALSSVSVVSNSLRLKYR